MNRVHIICVHGTDSLSETQISAISKTVSSERRRRAESYLHRTDRNNCLVAEFLLLTALYEKYGIRYLPRVCHGIYGKPYFTDPAFGCFNISHSGDNVCCALADSCIGVDIQNGISSPESLISIAMSQNEIEQIRASSNPKIISAVYWSRKEAYIKYLANGIDEKIKQYDFSAFKASCFSYRGLHFFTEMTENYALSCCSVRNDFTLRQITAEQLTERYQMLLCGN